MNKFLNVLIGGLQEHQSIKTDGISTALTSSMGMGGGYVPLVIMEVDDVSNRDRTDS